MKWSIDHGPVDQWVVLFGVDLTGVQRDIITVRRFIFDGWQRPARGDFATATRGLVGRCRIQFFLCEQALLGRQHTGLEAALCA